MLFADRVHKYFYNDGLLTPDSAAALYQERLDEIYGAVVGDSARWGDNRRSAPYTRDGDWVDVVLNGPIIDTAFADGVGGVGVDHPLMDLHAGGAEGVGDGQLAVQDDDVRIGRGRRGRTQADRSTGLSTPVVTRPGVLLCRLKAQNGILPFCTRPDSKNTAKT